MPHKTFTYKVVCSFEMQITFPESEVQPCEGVLSESEGPQTVEDEDMEPTELVLERLEAEIKQCLSNEFCVEGDVEVDCSLFLGVETND